MWETRTGANISVVCVFCGSLSFLERVRRGNMGIVRLIFTFPHLSNIFSLVFSPNHRGKVLLHLQFGIQYRILHTHCLLTTYLLLFCKRAITSGTHTGLSKKVSASVRELAPSTVASSRNLAKVCLDNPVYTRPNVEFYTDCSKQWSEREDCNVISSMSLTSSWATKLESLGIVGRRNCEWWEWFIHSFIHSCCMWLKERAQEGHIYVEVDTFMSTNLFLVSRGVPEGSKSEAKLEMATWDMRPVRNSEKINITRRRCTIFFGLRYKQFYKSKHLTLPSLCIQII